MPDRLKVAVTGAGLKNSPDGREGWAARAQNPSEQERVGACRRLERLAHRQIIYHPWCDERGLHQAVLQTHDAPPGRHPA